VSDTSARPDPGSFRDHRSRVFAAADTVYRGLDEVATKQLKDITERAFFRTAMERGEIVPTRWVDEAPAAIAVDDTRGFTGWLAHDRLPVVSYPYEWTFSMLRDAALLQLRLLTAALAEDVITKDASPYNVQFVGGRPTFIDVGSFEPYESGEPWYGYRQFCQLNLFPLLFQAYRDIPFQPLLRGSLDGITPAEARQILGGWKRRWKGLPVHVWLHARLEARLAGRDEDVKQNVRAAGFNKRLIEANATKLTALVGGLEWKASDSEWSSYSERAHYSDRDLAAKEDFVRRVAADVRPQQAWDVGANDGHFSRLVAEHAGYVLALDADHLVADLLYRRLHEEGNEKILPLVVNLADPSPALGWRARERGPLWDRSTPDLAVYLAVIHHLTITHHVPVPAFLDFVRDTTPRAVIEFPDHHDPMVQKLLRGKQAGLHGDYRLDEFERLVAERFEVLERQDLPSGTRTLFDLRRR
jgi:hypothetical protein